MKEHRSVIPVRFIFLLLVLISAGCSFDRALMERKNLPDYVPPAEVEAERGLSAEEAVQLIREKMHEQFGLLNFEISNLREIYGEWRANVWRRPIILGSHISVRVSGEGEVIIVGAGGIRWEEPSSTGASSGSGRASQDPNAAAEP